MGIQFSKRTTAVLASTAVVVLGTVGVVSATSGQDNAKGSSNSSTTQRQRSTSTAEAHDMDSHGHNDSTGTTHGGHDDNHNDSTGTTHGGHDDNHNGSGGSTTTHGGHDGHTGTTVSGSGGSTTTHGGHDHTPTTVGGSGTTNTTHNHGSSTTHNHGSSTTGGGGSTTTHHHGGGPVVQFEDLPIDVQAQVDIGTQVALQYPTTADASAAGWSQATVFFPGIAAHYLQAGWLDSTFDPAKPEVLLYGADGELVGVNYIVYNGATPPQGFAGSDDVWHEHPALCRSLTTGLIIGGEDLSPAECAAIGGVSFSFAGFYLLHVWTIPGYTSPEGVFSHENSLVK